jgi:hypothetical protein
LLGSCIAMHVRHGDSCGASVHGLRRQCFPLEAFVAKATRIALAYGGGGGTTASASASANHGDSSGASASASAKRVQVRV